MSSEVVFEDTVVDVGGNTFPTQKAILSSGAMITKLNGVAPVAVFSFVYEDAVVRFRFQASRWTDDFRPSDTWMVFIGLGLDGMPDSAKKLLKDDVLRDIASNIRQALLAWPPTVPEAPVKLKRVVFGKGGWRNPPPYEL